MHDVIPKIELLLRMRELIRACAQALVRARSRAFISRELTLAKINTNAAAWIRTLDL